MAKILIVEDDAELCAALKSWLKKDKHTVDVAGNGRDGLDLMRRYNFDVVILDWQIPGMEGPEVCRQLRNVGGNVPLLMLTAKAAITDKQTAFDAGADDYLTKPFDPRELSMRITALLRRQALVRNIVLTCGDIELDTQLFRAAVGGKEVALLPKEFALLEFFMKHQNQIFSSEALLDRIWSSESTVSPDTIRVHLTKLRSKISVNGKPCPIETIHGVGYRMRSTQ